jgi:hypothetical protein
MNHTVSRTWKNVNGNCRDRPYISSRSDLQDRNYLDDLTLAESHFRAFLDTYKTRDQAWKTVQVLEGDLLRQLGRFEEAEQHLKLLLEFPEFSERTLSKVIRFELDLCRARDVDPHALSEVFPPPAPPAGPPGAAPSTGPKKSSQGPEKTGKP